MVVTRLTYATLAGLLLATAGVRAEEEETPAAPVVFSGPQKGEKLLPFPVIGVYDDLAGKELDWMTEGAGLPVFLVFVHKVTRPAFGLTRLLTSYAADQKDKEGNAKLDARIVWLDEDTSKAEEFLTRVRQSLGTTVPVGISVDGAEGPGAYGLNRNVTMTVLVGVQGKVTANFALVQPSDTDAPEILAELAAVIGEKAPTPEDLAKYGRSGNRRNMRQRIDPELRRLVARLRPGDLTEEMVVGIAKEIENYAGEDRKKLRDLGVIATAFSKREDFASMGTEPARAQIRDWAKKYGRGRRRAGRRRETRGDPELGSILRRVIGKDMTREEVDEAATRAEKYIEEHEDSVSELLRISRVVLEREYGTERAREHFKNWVKKYSEKVEDKPRREEGKTDDATTQ